MGTNRAQIDAQERRNGPALGPPQLLTVGGLCSAFAVSASWVYKHTKKGAKDPLPVVRFGRNGLRFDPDKISTYIRSRERHRPSVTLDSSDGIARVSGKGHYKLTRKRFQAGSVRLREDRGPAYWQGFYREDFVDEAGRTVRKRVAVNLGLLTEIRNEEAARAKLAVILDPINDAKHRPKKMMTFRSFIEKYRALKLVNKKGTTKHGYETNIRAHYLPEFGDMELSDITLEAVQAFLNQKALEGKAVQTLKNLKWGLSSIFRAAMKYGYMKSNPARGADLPPEGIKERQVLPSPAQLNRLIERLKEPVSMAVWLTAVSCVRPEELAFKWKDLNAERHELWVVRAVNRGKLHTPKYHRANRPIRLTEADVERLLALKARTKAKDDDWVFPNNRKTGPIWHEDLLARCIQPAAKELGLPHITWRLLRHWGATQMAEGHVPIKAAQERLGHSRPDILLKFYTHVLDESADMAAETLSGQLNVMAVQAAD
ncbi:MAG TPA: tyrosine-type recombinase/integrase [Terracidiphilus sp.]|nr:tyrosine-type recombinase/integrase [Terracidiphilus sp.]